MKKTQYVISRAINGISINGREFVLDDKDELMLFDTTDSAEIFLKDNGIDNPEDYGIEISEFEPENPQILVSSQ